MPYDGPKPVPAEVKDLQEALAYTHSELSQVATEGQIAVAFNLLEQHEEPKKPRNGMIVWAGSGWDPGAGQGIYGRYGGAWHKLG